MLALHCSLLGRCQRRLDVASGLHAGSNLPACCCSKVWVQPAGPSLMRRVLTQAALTRKRPAPFDTELSRRQQGGPDATAHEQPGHAQLRERHEQRGPCEDAGGAAAAGEEHAPGRHVQRCRPPTQKAVSCGSRSHFGLQCCSCERHPVLRQHSLPGVDAQAWAALAACSQVMQCIARSSLSAPGAARPTQCPGLLACNWDCCPCSSHARGSPSLLYLGRCCLRLTPLCCRLANGAGFAIDAGRRACS